MAAGFSLKDQLFNAESVGWLAGRFPFGPGFAEAVLARFPELELKQRIDWIALQAHAGQRAGAIAAVLGGVALVYFVQLHLSGLRLAAFLRRG